MTRMTEQERETFLAEPRIAVLSVADDGDRPPLTVPVFYGYRPGGTLTFFTGTEGRTARKTRLIERAGVLSLCVQQEQWPYKYVTVEGRLESVDRPPSVEQMLEVLRRYLPEDDARQWTKAELDNPDNTMVLFTVAPRRWLTNKEGE